jgi:hypothetical protein
MKDKIKIILNSKRTKYLIIVSVLILAYLALNIAYAAFTSNSSNAAANITVKGMNYTIAINGTAGSVVTGTANTITKSNITITAANSLDSKYELTYVVCSDSSCTSTIATPSGFSVKYSSRTTDPITGTVTSTGAKNIRIIINNTTATTYYIKLGINAGYSYNTLTLNNSISSEYNEDDLTILAKIDGVSSSTLPTTANYSGSVTCQTDGGSSNATATTSWNGSKWVVNVSGVDDSQTVCTASYTPAVTLAIYGGTLSSSSAPNGGSVTISSVTSGYSSTGAGIKCSSGTTASIAGTTVTINSVGTTPTCTVVLSKLFDYTGGAQSYTIPITGTYKLQVWGAQGGTVSSKTGGLGGYSIGTLVLSEIKNFYVYVGGSGSTSAGGFNGGGGRGSTSAAGGGGATDIRIDTNSDGTGTLYERVIVAGGGGGSGQDSCATASTGYGGGLTGGGSSSQGSCGTQAGGGTQTAGGSGGLYSGTYGASGTFGTGGTATDGSYDGGGGGGGWYGGGSGASAGWSNAGGGGSGYVYTSSTATNCPSGCLLTSTYYLTSATTYAGNVSFASTSGGTETGHTGNGYAIISLVG